MMIFPMNKPTLLCLGILFFVGLALVITSLFFFIDRSAETDKQLLILKPVNPFETLSLKARSAVVWDVVGRKVLYSFNEEAQLPMASLAKLMTALIAVESLPEGTVVTVAKGDVEREGDSGLLVGERWHLNDLVDLTLTSSSNDGASALASAVDASPVFTERMNSKVEELGMAQTYFINESGLDVSSGISGAYSSAKDIALLIDYILKKHPRLFKATGYGMLALTSLDDIDHEIKNTNEMVAVLPGIIASKTGFTDLAGGNLVIVFEAGPVYPIVVVVLGSTLEERFSDIEQLIWASLAYLQQY